jgi:Ni/Fe-hydrogenase 1 B-type cytochrome subunit
MSDRKRVYVWELPIRLTHWLNFLCILTLSVTGFYIGSPFIHAYSSKQYIMGWMMLVHFIAAYIFLMNIIIRLYWSFAGNKYARITNWLPSSGEKMGHVFKDVKCNLLIDRKEGCYVGHSPLGGLTYLMISFPVFIFEIISGFALHSSHHSGFIWTLLGGWLTGIMLLPTIRLYHHIFMYVLLAFGMFHVYIAWFSDSRENSGLMGSIFTGNKFVHEKDLQ